jgi:hypothetical protein
MAAGLLLCPKLWLSSRLYPLTPVFGFLKPLPALFDLAAYVSLLILLFIVLIHPRPGKWIAAFLAALLMLCLQDQSRWQPWCYQYAFMLAAVGLASEARSNWLQAINTCRLIVAATYFWSGAQKLHANFVPDVFDWMAAGLIKRFAFVHYLGHAVPFVEIAIGLGLLTHRFRRPAIVLAIATHGFVLLTIGPFGRDANSVVWPWNIAMILFDVMLFWNADVPIKEIVWTRQFGFHAVAIFLFGIAPFLSFFNLWDSYLSASLYSGNKPVPTLYISDELSDKLPDDLGEYTYRVEPGKYKLDILEWPFDELKAPAYPEVRIYKNMARWVCSYGGDVTLSVKGKLALAGGGRESVYRCPDLRN